MTKQELIKLLKTDVKAFNEYRDESEFESIDLSEANLSGAYLRDANLIGADLRGANLCDAYLIGAYLRCADLRGANLNDVDLCDADLCVADLRGASLVGADLSGADLSDSDLRDANLRGADLIGHGLSRHIKFAQFDEWRIAWTDSDLQIGCQRHSIAAWRDFDDADISKMDRDALEWWERYKEPLMALIAASMDSFK